VEFAFVFRQVASAEQLKMATERELNKGLFALTSVRQELEEVSQMKRM
jgi:hypothetical protein